MTTLRWPVDGDHKARRERIAIAALQGIVAADKQADGWTAKDAAHDAVLLADALIKELDKEKQP